MKTISGYILTGVLGWKINAEFPDVKKSVVIFAPHTSYYDGLYGKLYFMTTGIHYKFLSKKEFFKFPMKYFFRAFGSIPVYKNGNYVDRVVELFQNSNELHIVLSPEGQMEKTSRWKTGYYYMAKKANVPIIVGYLDYKKREIGVKKIITDLGNFEDVKKEIARLYFDVAAKYSEKFSIDIN